MTYNIDNWSRPHRVRWYRAPNGHMVSYQFNREENAERHRAMLRHGHIEIENPFRKGAPKGGYGLDRCAAVPQIGAAA